MQEQSLNVILPVMLQDFTLKTLFESIPAVVYSGILGACIALFGTYLQNRFNSKQQKERLKHESEERKKEREMTMRRDIYLSGAEALGKMQRYLTSFADFNLESEQQNQILFGVNESLNKVAVIASFEIIESLAEIQSYNVRVVTELLEAKTQISIDIQYKLQLESHIEDLRQKGLQQIELHKSLKHSGDEATLISINERFQEIDDEKTKSEKLLNDLKPSMAIRQFEIIKKTVDAALQFEFLAGKANTKVRQELGFPIDETKYLDLILKTTKDNNSHFTQWIDNIFEKHKDDL